MAENTGPITFETIADAVAYYAPPVYCRKALTGQFVALGEVVTHSFRHRRIPHVVQQLIDLSERVNYERALLRAKQRKERNENSPTGV